MKTSIIKWDESMAMRCLARCKDYYTHAKYLPRSVNRHKAAKVKATPKKVISVDIPKGEWDDFQHALSSTLKKKHK